MKGIYPVFLRLTGYSTNSRISRSRYVASERLVLDLLALFIKEPNDAMRTRYELSLATWLSPVEARIGL